MSIQISYRFVIKNEKNKDGLYPIYLRAFLKGRKIETATTCSYSFTGLVIKKSKGKNYK